MRYERKGIIVRQARFKLLTAAFNRYKNLHPELTQATLANKLNVSQSVVSKWLTGRQDIPLDKVPKLAKALNCTTDYLLGVSDLPTVELDPRAAGEYTGLSEDAIAALHDFEAAPFALDYQDAVFSNFPNYSPEIIAQAKAALSALICMPEFRGALASIKSCREANKKANDVPADGVRTKEMYQAEYQSDYMRYRIIDAVSDCLKQILAT